MATSEVVKTAAWYHGTTAEYPRWLKFAMEGNKSGVMDYLEQEAVQITPAAIVKLFQDAERLSPPALPNGFVLGVKPDETVLRRQREDREAAEKAEAERQRLAVIEEENRRFALINFCAEYRCKDPNGQRIEKELLSQWDTPRLQAYADGIKLQRQSKGMTAKEFAQNNFLDETPGPGPLVLPADFNARKYHRMTGAEIRLFVRALVVKTGRSDREVWAAVNQRVAETKGQEA
jgi:hypothetical protein